MNFFKALLKFIYVQNINITILYNQISALIITLHYSISFNYFLNPILFAALEHWELEDS